MSELLKLLDVARKNIFKVQTELEKIKAENEKLGNKAETFEIENKALWQLIVDKGYQYKWQRELEAVCELSASHSLKQLEGGN